MRLTGTSVYADWASLSSVTDLAFEHGRLDLIGKNREMVGQPLEQVALSALSVARSLMSLHSAAHRSRQLYLIAL